mmetsp:Transcript_20406/g.65738  ORF Transcript_20406/g.65738 Transcript_20406/m.65738 type:complete len:327 (-) Transcript_20406:743-1723(-)
MVDGKATQTMPPRWLLIDGHNLMYRAFYAMPELTKDGQPVGAVLGTSNMLMKVALPYALRGARVVFVVDGPAKTWRSDLDPNYKATRSRMPDDLRTQIEDTQDAARAFGARVLEVPGHEADDVIATLAVKHAEDGVDVWSTDKDLLQLLAVDGVRILDKDGVASTADDVARSFGVAPSQIADYLAMVGDTSDNVKGIKGIGPKTAAKFLTAFDTLDRVLEEGPTSLTAGPAKRKLLADADRDTVELARKLVTLNRDVPIPDDEEEPEEEPAGDVDGKRILADQTTTVAEKKEGHFDWDRLIGLADRYGFAHFRSRVIRAMQNEGPF